MTNDTNTPLTPYVVLYAEDDPNDAFFMRRAFGKLGEGVMLKIAPHGRAVIEYLTGVGEHSDRTRSPLPALLVLDVKMPELSGLEVLAWLKEQAEFAAIPVVMFTSSTQESDVARSRTLGANAFLMKPSNSTHLSRLMQEVIEAAKAEPQPGGRLPLEANLLND